MLYEDHDIKEDPTSGRLLVLISRGDTNPLFASKRAANIKMLPNREQSAVVSSLNK